MVVLTNACETARLSSKTAKIFLSLLLLTWNRFGGDPSSVRHAKDTHIKPEFATRELEVDGFIPSIAYNGRSRIVSVEESTRNAAEDENAVKVPNYSALVVEENINSDATLLVSDDLGDNTTSSRATEDVLPQSNGSREPTERGAYASDTPLERCRLADERGDRKAQVSALVACWDEAFPIEEYPYQRLTVATAKKFLVNRSAEDVGQVILRVGALGHSDYPRSRVEKVLAVEEKRDKITVESGGNKAEDAGEITDEIKEYTKWALEQWSKNDENSRRYK